MEEYKCPTCGETTSDFGKCADEYYCGKCEHSFIPYIDTVPCKICGSDMTVTAIQSYHGTEHRRVFCECGVAGPYSIDAERAHNAWNKLNS